MNDQPGMYDATRIVALLYKLNRIMGNGNANLAELAEFAKTDLPELTECAYRNRKYMQEILTDEYHPLQMKREYEEAVMG